MKLKGLIEMFVVDGDEPDVIEGESDAPFRGCRVLALSLLLFWVAVGAGLFVFFYM